MSLLPKIDPRREEEFLAEMQQLALTWIPDWGILDSEEDYAHAIMQIAARYCAEVSERIDRAGDKMRCGLMDWLGIRGQAAIPARMPVVFRLTEGTSSVVLAQAPITLQADVKGASVVFETEADLNISPSRIASIVASHGDTIYLPPPGLSSLDRQDGKPTFWKPKSLTPVGSAIIQVSPDIGLEPGLLLRVSQQEHLVEKVEGDLVTIRPPLESIAGETTLISAVDQFSPFDQSRNWQEHALYLGDDNLFQIDSAAMIEINIDPVKLPVGTQWEYWGKVGTEDATGWQPFESQLPDKNQQTKLAKPNGPIEEFEIRGRKSRWIRAISKYSKSVVELAEVGIKNSSAKSDDAKGNQTQVANPVYAEGMANTTPLVLENTFYPLGKTPKQFDAFYLGCKEAFSKKGSTVNLYFGMNDRTQVRLAALSREPSDNRFVGVGSDGRFYGFTLESSSKNVLCSVDGFEVKRVENNNSILVRLDKPEWRLPTYFREEGKYSALLSAGDEVWSVNLPEKDAISLGQVQPDAKIACLERTSADLILAVTLHNQSQESEVYLYVKESKKWEAIPNTKEVLKISAIYSDTQAESALARVFVAVTKSKDLLLVDESNGKHNLTDDINPQIQPIAVSVAPDRIMVFSALVNSTNEHKAVMVVATKEGGNWKRIGNPALLPLKSEPIGFEWVRTDSEIRLVVTTRSNSSTPGSQQLTVWRFSNQGIDLGSFSSTSTPGIAQGVAVVVAGSFVIPGPTGQFYIGDFKLTEPIIESVPRNSFKRGFAANDTLDIGDSVWSPTGQKFDIVSRYPEKPKNILFELKKSLSKGVTKLFAFPKTTEESVDVKSKDEIILKSNIEVDAWLFINNEIRKVLNVDVVTTGGISTTHAKLDREIPNLPTHLPTSINAKRGFSFDVTPWIFFASRVLWSKELIEEFQISYITEQTSVYFVGPENESIATVWLKSNELPTGNSSVLVTARRNSNLWSHFRPNDSSNPDLSWEYWNGTGWWTLPILADETRNLKISGNLRFRSPSDISQSDWSGKTNYWIRARLIGGDYGRENVTITQTDKKLQGITTQIIDRSQDGFSPPTVGRLTVTYSSDQVIAPTYLLTEDSKTIRDQSDANRTEGAQVEAFVPLDVALSRLEKTSVTVNQNPEAEVETNDSRYLFVGIDGPIAGPSFNLLILVDEQDYSDFAPIQIEALVANQFVPLVCSDQTRGMGETGLVRLLVNTPPTPAELFGQSLRWLRLAPKRSSNTDWQPKIRGVYINAVWASATETMTRELLGSSDGSPNLKVTLARPPVLHNTLELRVRELLSENERKELQQKLDADPNSSRSVAVNTDRSKPVISDVENLPGDWVLWKQVTDPLDEAPNARVYSLDEESGVIRFGDGLHGMIPPIGKDSIVAFGYKRTEPAPAVINGAQSPVPGNLIEPKAALNLVSPVSSVDAVFAADQSAGGVTAQPSAKVVKTGYASLRHRQRILTVQDLEQRLLEFAPEAAQAKAFVSAGLVEVVVVNNGKNPQPTAQQTRAWKQRVLDCAAPWLSSIRTFRILGPTVVSLKVELQVVIDSLDSAGSVAEEIRQRLTRYFDVSEGGIYQQGWMLGQNANEQEIALAIRAITHVESLRQIRLIKVTNQDELSWPSKLGARELVRLNEDFVQLTFLTRDSIRSEISTSNLVGGVR